MLTKREKFNKLVDYFLKTDEMCYYNPYDWRIVLHGIKNTNKEFKRLRKEIDKITTKYKFTAHKGDELVNVTISDIEL